MLYGKHTPGQVLSCHATQTQTLLQAPVDVVGWQTCLVWVNKLLMLCEGLWQGEGAPWQGAFRAPQLHAQPQNLERHLSNSPAAGFRQDLHRQTGLMLP